MASVLAVVLALVIVLVVSLSLSTFLVLHAEATENSWTTKASMPEARGGVKAAVVNGKIYAIASDVNYEYDPATDTWETKEPMPTNRSQLNANVVNGKIYLIGGRTSSPRYSTVALNEIYDIANDSWTTKKPIPYPVVDYASAVVDNKIYVISGQDEFLHNDINVKFNQIYDPETDTWSLGASLPTAVLNAAAGATTGIMAPKRIYVMGGEGGFVEPLNQNYVYDPQADVWSSGASLPTPRIDPAVAVVNDLLYAIGGIVGWRTVTAAVEQYTPFGYGTIQPSFPTTWIVATTAITTVVGAALLVYFRKIKKTTGKGG